MVDGLKPGQRKILFACFKRNLRADIKVAQLAGYVAEHSAYHHGEASLAATIVGLAQSFVGSNNVIYLVPQGEVGGAEWAGDGAMRGRAGRGVGRGSVVRGQAGRGGAQHRWSRSDRCGGWAEGGGYSIPAWPPAGQFGTRLQGGKDAASPRYIFTRMAPLTRHLFNEHDDRLLSYLNEEGQSIEPEWWVRVCVWLGPGWHTECMWAAHV